ENAIQDSGVACLASNLSNCKNLQSLILWLSGNKICDLGAFNLVSGLLKCTKLSVLQPDIHQQFNNYQKKLQIKNEENFHYSGSLAIAALAQDCPPNSSWYKNQECSCINGYYGYEYNTGSSFNESACKTCAQGYYYQKSLGEGREAGCAQRPEGTTQIEPFYAGGTVSQCKKFIPGYYMTEYADGSFNKPSTYKKMLKQLLSLMVRLCL
ncbi:hypothetical protein ABPG72_011156, partial [Tetrahymena utriculariae]